MTIDPLSAILRPARLTAVVDVGASPLDGGAPPYKSMLEKGLCTLVGFDPQQQAIKALQARKSAAETYLPYAVGDGDEHTLHICSGTGMTSLLEPDPLSLQMFKGFSDWGRVVRREPVKTVRLDDVAEVERLDFLKIDVQGGELAVFKGGREKLRSAVVVQTEVSFVQLYKEQPTAGEIDAELRGLGFIPHAFAAIHRRLLAPFGSPDPAAALNQLLEADLVYVRDFRLHEQMSDAQLTHLALVAHHAYASFDLAAKCIEILWERKAVARDAFNKYAAIAVSAPRQGLQPR